MGWLDRIYQQLKVTCNGTVIREGQAVVCKMDNGKINIFEQGDTKTLIVHRGKPEEEIEARYEMDFPHTKNPYDEPVITASPEGSLEIKRTFSNNPFIRVKQNKRKFGKISTSSSFEGFLVNTDF